MAHRIIFCAFEGNKTRSSNDVTRWKKRQQNTSIKNLIYLRFIVLNCCWFVTHESRNLMSSCSFVARITSLKSLFTRVSAFFVSYRFMYRKVTFPIIQLFPFECAIDAQYPFTPSLRCRIFLPSRILVFQFVCLGPILFWWFSLGFWWIFYRCKWCILF